MSARHRRVTDAATIRAIEAEFAAAVYDAARLAELRLRGVEPPPIPSVRGLRIRREIEDRGGQPDRSARNIEASRA